MCTSNHAMSAKEEFILMENEFEKLKKKAGIETKVYDMFSSSNPFSVDYTQYADCGATVAYNGGFLSDFSSAVSTLSSEGGFSSSDGGAFSGGCDAGFSGGATSSCGASSGGFTSVC